MLTINIKNGEFKFDKWTFSPIEKLSNIKKKLSPKEFELRLKNDPWETYRLNVSEDFIFRILFFNEDIKFIEIYPEIINEHKFDEALQKILRNLCGQNNYYWGKVELNIDHKSGYKSVVISYNSHSA